MDVTKFNPNYNPKTFFLDSNSKTKEKKKEFNKKTIISSGALGSAGAVLGYKTAEKKSGDIIIKMQKNAYDKKNNVAAKIWDFIRSPEAIVKNSLEGITNEPYLYIKTWFDKMEHLKDYTPREVEMPNCILFVGQDENKTKKFIDWFANSAKQRYVTINGLDLEKEGTLELFAENFKKTGKWNLVYVKDMDKMINPKYASSQNIADMKALMCQTSKYYNTTLIFQTKDWKKLDNIAIASNRVGKFIDVDHLPKLKKIQRLTKKYNKQRDFINNLLDKNIQDTTIKKLKKLIILKGAVIGFLIPTAIISGIFLIKKIINNKGIKNENRK